MRAPEPSELEALVGRLAALLAEPARVSELPRERVPALLAQLAAAQAVLAARMMTAEPENGAGNGNSQERWLTADEAAEISRVSRRWLLRHTRRMKFRRDLSRKRIRFEENGLRRWLAAQA